MEGKILVVDDEKVCRDTMQYLLTNQGCEVVVCENGRRALDYLRAHPHEIDLIILDLMMPEMNGIETLSELKQDQELNTIPVIIESGANEYDQALRLGVESLIPKPYKNKHVIYTVNKVLASHH